MTIDEAQKLMADAVEAMLACGPHRVASTTVTKTLVDGRTETVTCLLFGPSMDVLKTIAQRIGEPSLEERIASTLTTRGTGAPH